MMLGLKHRFAKFVEEGSKTHTIRGKRKIPPKVGDGCHCFVNPRQKSMRLLGRFVCVKVEDIRIYTCGDGRFSVILNGDELTPDEKDALAWRDGFRGRDSNPRGAFAEMMRFWMETHSDGTALEVSYVNFLQGEPFLPGHGKGLDFHGDLIHWKYESGTKRLSLKEWKQGRP